MTPPPAETEVPADATPVADQTSENPPKTNRSKTSNPASSDQDHSTSGSNSEEDELEQSNAPLLDHIAELRKRLIICVACVIVVFFVAFAFADELFDILTAPLARTFEGLADSQRRLIYTSLPEQFLTQVKLAFYAALFVGCPLILNQIWMFLAPGLYRKEKRAFLPFLAATPVLFALGVIFVYWAVIPAAWSFFASFEVTPGQGNLPIELEPKVSEYLSLVLRLMFAFGLAFEVPLLLVILVVTRLTTTSQLRRWRRYAIVVSFILAAILTPPDPLSQIGLALPLIVFYELSILTASFIERRRSTEESLENPTSIPPS